MVTTILMCHAAGLCGRTWRPIISHIKKLLTVEELKEYQFINFDFSFHGDATTGAGNGSWNSWCVDDILRITKEVPSGKLIGVGHSLGGAALLHTEMQQPGTFHSLLVFEPVVSTFPKNQFLTNVLPEMTLRRKRQWKNVEDARSYFHSKPLFQAWDHEMLDAYLEGGLFIHPDATCTLKCSPENEAKIYGEDLFVEKNKLMNIRCPVQVYGGKDSMHFVGKWGSTEDFLRATADSIPTGQFHVLDNCGHFLVQEKPVQVAGLIAQHVKNSKY